MAWAHWRNVDALMSHRRIDATSTHWCHIDAMTWRHIDALMPHRRNDVTSHRRIDATSTQWCDATSTHWCHIYAMMWRHSDALMSQRRVDVTSHRRIDVTLTHWCHIDALMWRHIDALLSHWHAALSCIIKLLYCKANFKFRKNLNRICWLIVVVWTVSREKKTLWKLLWRDLLCIKLANEVVWFF